MRMNPDIKVVIHWFNLDVVVAHNKRTMRLRTDKGASSPTRDSEISVVWNSASD